MTIGVWWLVGTAWAGPPFLLDGTQPHELQVPLDHAQSCVLCHSGFDGASFDAWRGTMMANAVVDPIFLAALTIAEQDLPDSGEFCLRCHTPNAWLQGRCLPGDGSKLTPSDIASGVSCDACHRMTEVDGGPFIGNAQYTYDDDPSKRGLLGSGSATHPVTWDPLQGSSDLCGVCHEVSNPALGDFPIELTWTEWSQSAFAAEGVQCQDCHMKVRSGLASNVNGSVERTVHEHQFVGGNAWVPEVMASTAADPARAAALLDTAAAARELHHEAVELDVGAATLVVRSRPARLVVSVENLTGHKLPSGYPEGRRAWLEVAVRDASGRELLHSGAYDPEEATLDEDEQVRIYQALLGSEGVQNYHMVKQDQLLVDTRIPPRGFRPSAITHPVGRTYAPMPDGTVSNVDHAPYTIDVPADAQGPLTVTATLWYQTTTRAFVTFLRDSNVTDDRGEELYELWDANGRCPPEEIATITTTFDVVAETDVQTPADEGCGCRHGGAVPWGGLVVGLLAWRRRSQRADA